MILIAPDKFKGTYTAAEVCGIIARWLRRQGVTEEIAERPMSDGGEGSAEVLLPGAEKIAPGLYEDSSRGLRLAVSSERVGHRAFAGTDIPLMHRSSYALGEVIAPGIPTMIAIGGTAVSDAGAGFLQALGARFFDKNGREITRHLTPATLCDVYSADLSALAAYDLKGIVDVKASLTDGPLSALDFARQKALPGEDLSCLRDALSHFQHVLGGCSGWDGAGGGLGYAIASVIKAPCVSGAQAAVDTLGIDWASVTHVYTGEGHVDRQTVRGGKLVDAVYRAATGRGIPCTVICGIADPDLPYPHIIPISEIISQLSSLSSQL